MLPLVVHQNLSVNMNKSPIRNFGSELIAQGRTVRVTIVHPRTRNGVTRRYLNLTMSLRPGQATWRDKDIGDKA